MLDDRRSKVLKALVEEYILTGEPVSSQSVIARSGLDVSSATVRNDLARLESYGFVAQPHTSAGRMPTHQGYRFYVDHLSPSNLRSRTRDQIDDFFRDVHSQVSVAIAENGRVHQEYVDIGVAIDDATVESAERLVAAAFHGHPLDAPEADRLRQSDLPAAVKRVIAPVSDRLSARPLAEREVFVGGTSQMASLWSDLTMVRHLLSLLDEEASLIDLLGDDTGETNVRFGPDFGEEGDLAVVTATYETPDGAQGRLGVIAPMRMNYRRTIRVVEEVSGALEDSFGDER